MTPLRIGQVWQAAGGGQRCYEIIGREDEDGRVRIRETVGGREDTAIVGLLCEENGWRLVKGGYCRGS